VTATQRSPKLGLAKKSRAAAEAVDLFARIYGAETGNLA